MTAARRLAAKVAAVLDRLDATLWEAERRQAWRERYTVPPGQESWYARMERLREEQERGRRD
jgi:hypothetical protein